MNSKKQISGLSPSEKRVLLGDLLKKRTNGPNSFYPLSFGQKALWLLYQIAPENTAYNEVFAWRIHHALDLPALRNAFQSLIDRHSALRATYAARDGEPVQQVRQHMQVDFKQIDTSTWTEDELSVLLAEETHCPFDLERGPIMRVRLFTRSVREHILLLMIHHIAIDFWSLTVLMEELGDLYLANQAAAATSLSPPSAQYPDYVQWQNKMLESAEGERLWAYWQRELAGGLHALNIPTDYPRKPIQTYRGLSYDFTIDAGLTEQLRSLARNEKTTPFVILLAAFLIVLNRYSGQEDILVGYPTAGRSRPEFERLVGYLVNPVVLRADLRGNPTFETFLRQTRNKVLAALDHQDYPFQQLVERLQPRRDPSRSPIFQVMFLWEKANFSDELSKLKLTPGAKHMQIKTGQLVLEPFAVEQPGVKFDLSLVVLEAGQSLSFTLQYNSDLFDADTIARMAGHYESVLEGIIANPQQRLIDLPLLAETEKSGLLEMNKTDVAVSQNLTLQQLFEAQVERMPDAVALSFGDVQMTYAELNGRANQVAAYLQRLGVRPEVPVGVCTERSIETVIGLLGTLKAGGIYVPLDPKYPSERLRIMLEDAGVQVLLTQRHLVRQLPEHRAQLSCLDENSQLPTQMSGENPSPAVTAENGVYIIFTSGSTGTPKGVIGLHRGTLNRLQWMWQTYPFAAGEVCCQKTSLSFVDSICEILSPLLQGIKLVIISDSVMKDPAQLVETLARYDISRLVLVPSLLSTLLDSHSDLQQRLPRLKLWVTSGEALSFHTWQRFQKLMPESILLNLYGSSEVSADVTWYETRRLNRASLSIPIGCPLANSRTYVLDAHLQLVPVGLPGELYAGGVGLARGYHNRPSLTGEKFIPDPFSDEPGGRLFKTGDLARYLPDGNIEFLGRMDHQVKVRGFRIELGEIEATLFQHPDVQQAVVIDREDKPGDKRLVAYLVLQPGTINTISEMRSFLRRTLPDYMIPAAFVIMDELPLSHNGKVDRRALPIPETTRPELKTAFVAPRNPTEKLLAQIWEGVLGIERVGIEDNFFDLGGASTQSLQIASQASEAKLCLTPDMLFQYPTIAELAEACGSSQFMQVEDSARSGV
jgi:amino acid adenylation domain-containing protein